LYQQRPDFYTEVIRSYLVDATGNALASSARASALVLALSATIKLERERVNID